MSEERPRVRVKAASRPQPNGHDPGNRVPWSERVQDSYQNFLASIGNQTQNLNAGGTYGFNPITRERILLEWLYRGSWVCGVGVDAIADDMTKLGIDFSGTIPPEDSDALEHSMNRMLIWNALNDWIKWGRLYGGSIAVIVIEGQDWATPLRVETIRPGGFKGLLVLDRWQVEPSLNDLVSDFGPDVGLPRYYRTHADAMAIPPTIVHYSRVMRYEGIRLPYWQRVMENLWGMSIFERLWDRLQNFDSATAGIAQLVYKAYLRVVKLKDLREAAALSPEGQRGIMRRLEFMTRFQTTEGVTLLGEGDEFEAITYAFSGLDEILTQFFQQIGGALQVPMVRLAGQSPAGLNATGDSDWRNYFDGIQQQQETRLRRGVHAVVHVAAKSERIKLPDNWTFAFRPLWQMTTKEKAEVADLNTRTVLAADELGVIPRKVTLQELRSSSRETGVFTTITDAMIDEAADEVPPPPGVGGVFGPSARPGAQPSAPPGAQLRGAPGEAPGQGQTGARAAPGSMQRNPVAPPSITLHGASS